MYDIKLYAKNEQEINILINLTWICSEDTGMTFRLENSNWIIVRREKVKLLGWNYQQAI